jgi:hypothetical protein
MLPARERAPRMLAQRRTSRGCASKRSHPAALTLPLSPGCVCAAFFDLDPIVYYNYQCAVDRFGVDWEKNEDYKFRYLPGAREGAGG